MNFSVSSVRDKLNVRLSVGEKTFWVITQVVCLP